MSLYVIACGGTGGHMAPGIAVAEELKSRGHDCVLLVSRKGVDGKLSAKYGDLRFVRSPGRGFAGGVIGFIPFAFSQLHSIYFAWRVLREKPAAVMAFGGFTSTGVVMAAKLRGIPVALHEANRNPGRAVRLLRHFAQRLYLPDGVRLPGVPASAIRYLGYPVRKEIQRADKKTARAEFGFDVACKLLVVLGGSQGASPLNKWAADNAKALCSNGISLCCVCGPDKSVPADFETSDSAGRAVKVRFLPFCDKMGTLLSAADIIVSRAGAGSIAEIVECGIPSILVPYPFAADNHQMANARYLEQQGGCVVLEQDRIEGLLSEVLDLAFSDWLLNRLCFNLEQIRRTDCASVTATDLIELGASAKDGVQAARQPAGKSGA
jgi:UDP-N-acetylglucosamine--N-acetylmuramyl-(pentapeptide) pyrophosphoryl-undecaprenol N-acetylglucosamine transferase